MDMISRVERHLFFIILYTMILISLLFSYRDYGYNSYLVLACFSVVFIYVHTKTLLRLVKNH